MIDDAQLLELDRQRLEKRVREFRFTHTISDGVEEVSDTSQFEDGLNLGFYGSTQTVGMGASVAGHKYNGRDLNVLLVPFLSDAVLKVDSENGLATANVFYEVGRDHIRLIRTEKPVFLDGVNVASDQQESDIPLEVQINGDELAYFCEDKLRVKDMLSEFGIPTPKYQEITNGSAQNTIDDFCRENNFEKIVVKGNLGGDSRFVRIFSANDSENAAAFADEVQKKGYRIFVEEKVRSCECNNLPVNVSSDHLIKSVLVLGDEPYFVDAYMVFGLQGEGQPLKDPRGFCALPMRAVPADFKEGIKNFTTQIGEAIEQYFDGNDHVGYITIDSIFDGSSFNAIELGSGTPDFVQILCGFSKGPAYLVGEKFADGFGPFLERNATRRREGNFSPAKLNGTMLYQMGEAYILGNEWESAMNCFEASFKLNKELRKTPAKIALCDVKLGKPIHAASRLGQILNDPFYGGDYTRAKWNYAITQISGENLK